MPKTSYMDFGGALSNYNNLMNQGYKDSIELAQRQQQSDYLYPKELSMGPSMLRSISGSPLNALANAAQFGRAESAPPPDREFYDLRGATPKQVYPQGSMNQAPEQSPELPMQDDSRMPASSNSNLRANINSSKTMMPAVKERLASAIEGFSNGKVAAEMGLKQDPETGRVYGPGRQMKEYYDMYDKIVGSQAAIMAAAARPQQAAAVTVIGNKGEGRAVTAKPTMTPAQWQSGANAQVKQNFPAATAMEKMLDPNGAAIKDQKRAEALSQIQNVVNQWAISGKAPPQLMQGGPSAPAAAPVNNNPPPSNKNPSVDQLEAGVASGKYLKGKNKVTGKSLYKDKATGEVFSGQ